MTIQLDDPQKSVIRAGIRRWMARRLDPPVSIGDVVEEKRAACELELLDAEEDMERAASRVAMLRIRLERLTGKANE